MCLVMEMVSTETNLLQEMQGGHISDSTLATIATLANAADPGVPQIQKASVISVYILYLMFLLVVRLIGYFAEPAKGSTTGYLHSI